jgi:hypothetical protein
VILRAPAFALLLALCACDRKAPGPDECRAFALAALGLSSEEELAGASPRRRAVRDDVDAITRECLVMPYDREFLRCTLETGRGRACRLAFDHRRANPGLSR